MKLISKVSKMGRKRVVNIPTSHFRHFKPGNKVVVIKPNDKEASE